MQLVRFPAVAAVLSISLLAGAATAQDDAAGQGEPAPEWKRVVATGAALRNLPDAQGHKVVDVAGGELVASYRENAGWFHVEVAGGVPAWIHGAYLTPTGTEQVLEVTGDGVNVRPRAAGGAANYPLGQLYRGDLVRAIRRADESKPMAEDWVQVWTPPGLRAWVRATDVEPLEAGADGAALWNTKLEELARSPETRRPMTREAREASSTKPNPAPTASQNATAALERADQLFDREKNRPMPDFGAVRSAYEEVRAIAPSSEAARLAGSRLETLTAFENATQLEAELEAERLRHEQELLRRQERAFEIGRRRDPLGAKFDARGILERVQIAGQAPRYVVRAGGEELCEVTCLGGRYDLALFTGYEIGIEGEVQTDAVEASLRDAGAGAVSTLLPKLDARRLRVLARR